MKKWNELSKKNKGLLIGAWAVIIVGAGFTGYKVSADNHYSEVKQDTQNELTDLSEKGKLATAIHGLLAEKGYLSKNVTEESVSKYQKELEKIQADVDDFEKLRNEQLDTKAIANLQAVLTEVQNKLEVEDITRTLFSLEGSLTADSAKNEQLVLADKINNDHVTTIEKGIKDKKLAKDSWLETVNQLTAKAKGQLKDIADAQKKVASLYKDNKVRANVMQKDYTSAETAVKKLVRESDKTALNKKLVEVKKVVDTNEKKAKEKAEKEKQEEAKKAAEQKATEVGGTIEQTNDGSYVVKADDGSEYQNSGNGSFSQTQAPSYSNSGNSSSSGHTANGNSSSGNSGNTGNNSSSGGNTTSNGNSGSQNDSNSNSGSNNTGSGSIGGSDTSSDPKPNTPATIVAGAIGNSGYLYETRQAAIDKAESVIWDETSDWYGYGYVDSGVIYSDGTTKWTINFY